MDFSRRTFSLLAGFIILMAGWMAWLLYHLDPKSPQEGSARVTIFIIGLVIGMTIACFITLAGLSNEITRFERQIKESGPDDKIRPPFSPYPITKSEFLKMWGTDNPDTFNPRGKA